MFRVTVKTPREHDYHFVPDAERSSLQGALDVVASLTLKYEAGSRFVVRDIKGVVIAKVTSQPKNLTCLTA